MQEQQWLMRTVQKYSRGEERESAISGFKISALKVFCVNFILGLNGGFACFRPLCWLVLSVKCHGSFRGSFQDTRLRSVPHSAVSQNHVCKGKSSEFNALGQMRAILAANKRLAVA